MVGLPMQQRFPHCGSFNNQGEIISNVAGLDISARPLAQASVKTVRQVQTTNHSPGLVSTISAPEHIVKIRVTFYLPL